ncbi:hypothetical protein SAMN05216387_101205 [Nitrosovibrio tenuis]|uniref:Uncharacterized protein n=1 Tax=Nitrosovibrio tenuis TaxID=1233 RepID=A0A1H7GCV6_9PROT|nr:hypothetical protein SAMN05216387_101205 [Nitrosovibrio tenuis]
MPIELRIRGNDLKANFDYANLLLPKIRAIAGIADVRIQQSRRQPVFDIDVDRTRAQQVAVTMRDVTTSLVANLAGSSQVAPLKTMILGKLITSVRSVVPQGI